MNVLGLVQLYEAAQPTGGYEHSFHIERLVRTGRLRSAEELVVLLRSVLDASIAPADGVASGIAFRAARTGTLDAIPEVCTALSSDRLPMEMRMASVQMGERLWTLSRAWPWAEPVHEQLDHFARHADLHYAVVLGALASETTSSQVRAIATALYTAARTIVMAAARAIPLEEAAGMQVLAGVQERIAQLATRYVDKQAGDIGVTGQ